MQYRFWVFWSSGKFITKVTEVYRRAMILKDEKPHGSEYIPYVIGISENIITSAPQLTEKNQATKRSVTDIIPFSANIA
jgi:hypothetical protein